ncbi:hypothetical protein HQ563_07730 [bacterium]|nr:hypothetical protein [bacterium]
MGKKVVTLVVLTVSCVLCYALSMAEEKASGPPAKVKGMPLVFKESFEKGNAERWQPSDTSAWKIVAEEDNHVYSLFKGSKYSPPVRSPLNFSLVKEITVSDFVFEAKLKSTNEEYGHRDLCLFFGYQDASHFYYVHLGSKADANANSIFIVNGEPRVSIAKTRTSGTKWDDKYHLVRVVRNVKNGNIKVFFDDMKKPVMTASDKTFAWGRLGLGSFDDTGNFDDVRVWGKVKPQTK